MSQTERLFMPFTLVIFCEIFFKAEIQWVEYLIYNHKFLYFLPLILIFH